MIKTIARAEFKADDSQHRCKSGVAEDFDKRQQLLSEINIQMKEANDAKIKKKCEKNARSERLGSYGE